MVQYQLFIITISYSRYFKFNQLSSMCCLKFFIVFNKVPNSVLIKKILFQKKICIFIRFSID